MKNKFAKRLLDILLSTSLVIIFLPAMLLISLVIYMVMGKPIIFRQERPGLYTKSFFIYKFRTMKDVKNEDGKLLSDEDRLTNLGKALRKLSLDELPQLFNVIKGDLSVVGPRPLLVEYLPLYTPEQARRHEVKPGITGWAQVNGRNTISWEEKFALDVWYVDNWSFWLDIRILWLTILKVIKSEGVCQHGQATTKKFRGNML